MHVFIYDFDQTLTLMHSCPNPNQPNRTVLEAELHLAVNVNKTKTREEFLRDNMKPGIADMFRAIWQKGHTVAIATFNIDIDLVHDHFRAIGLTQTELSRIVLRYRVDPSTLPENKNQMVDSIIDEVGPGNVTGITFVDDSRTNTRALQSARPDADVIQVNRRDPSTYGDFITQIIDMVGKLESASIHDLDRISDIVFAKAEKQQQRLNKWYRINGKLKAGYIKHSIGATKAVLAELKGTDSLTSEAFINAFKETRSSDGKTMMDSLGYHRLFSRKQQGRKEARALDNFKTQQRYIR